MLVNTYPNVEKGAREATSLKKTTTVLWPRMRPQGTASALVQYFSTAYADRVPYVPGTRAAAAPEFHSGPVRRGASDRNTRPRPSSREEEFNGESDESVADGGIGSYNSAGRGRGDTRIEIVTITSDEDPGATTRS